MRWKYQKTIKKETNKDIVQEKETAVSKLVEIEMTKN